MENNIVEEWLRSLNLVRYTEAFLDNGYDDLEVCKQIGELDLDAIGVEKLSHRKEILKAARNLEEEGGTAVYFTLEDPNRIYTQYADKAQLDKFAKCESRDPSPSKDCCAKLDEYEEGKKTLVTYPQQNLKSIIVNKLIEEDIDLSSPPYTNHDGTKGSMDAIAEKYAKQLNTHVMDVMQRLEELRKQRLSHNFEIMVSSSSTAGNCDTPSPTRHWAPPLPKCPPPSTSHAERRSQTTSPTVSQNMQDSATASPSKKQETPEKKKSSGISRFFKGRKSSKKLNYNTKHKCEIHASEITMSDDDRIQLMVLVKEGKITPEEAVETVKLYEQEKRRGIVFGDDLEDREQIQNASPSSPLSILRFSSLRKQNGSTREPRLYTEDPLNPDSHNSIYSYEEDTPDLIPAGAHNSPVTHRSYEAWTRTNYSPSHHSSETSPASRKLRTPQPRTNLPRYSSSTSSQPGTPPQTRRRSNTNQTIASPQQYSARNNSLSPPPSPQIASSELARRIPQRSNGSHRYARKNSVESHSSIGSGISHHSSSSLSHNTQNRKSPGVLPSRTLSQSEIGEVHGTTSNIAKHYRSSPQRSLNGSSSQIARPQTINENIGIDSRSSGRINQTKLETPSPKSKHYAYTHVVPYRHVTQAEVYSQFPQDLSSPAPSQESINSTKYDIQSSDDILVVSVTRDNQTNNDRQINRQRSFDSGIPRSDSGIPRNNVVRRSSTSRQVHLPLDGHCTGLVKRISPPREIKTNGTLLMQGSPVLSPRSSDSFSSSQEIVNSPVLQSPRWSRTSQELQVLESVQSPSHSPHRSPLHTLQGKTSSTGETITAPSGETTARLREITPPKTFPKKTPRKRNQLQRSQSSTAAVCTDTATDSPPVIQRLSGIRTVHTNIPSSQPRVNDTNINLHPAGDISERKQIRKSTETDKLNDLSKDVVERKEHCFNKPHKVSSLKYNFESHSSPTEQKRYSERKELIKTNSAVSNSPGLTGNSLGVLANKRPSIETDGQLENPALKLTEVEKRNSSGIPKTDTFTEQDSSNTSANGLDWVQDIFKGIDLELAEETSSRNSGSVFISEVPNLQPEDDIEDILSHNSKADSFSSDSTMSVGSDASPQVQRKKSAGMLDKIKKFRLQRSASYSTGDELHSTDCEEQDDLEKKLGHTGFQRESSRSSFSDKVRGLKKNMKQRLSRLRGPRHLSDTENEGEGTETTPSGSGTQHNTNDIVEKQEQATGNSEPPTFPKPAGMLGQTIETEEESVYCGRFVGRAIVHTDYTPSPYDREALKLKKGDMIRIIDMAPTGIWTGLLNEKIGTFKFINVDLIPDETPRRIRRQMPNRKRNSKRRSKPKTVEELLKRLGLENLLSVFLLHGYDNLEVFSELEKEDLDELRIIDPEQRAMILTAAELLDDMDFDNPESPEVAVKNDVLHKAPVNSSPVSQPQVSHPSSPSSPRDSGCYASNENIIPKLNGGNDILQLSSSPDSHSGERAYNNDQMNGHQKSDVDKRNTTDIPEVEGNSHVGSDNNCALGVQATNLNIIEKRDCDNEKENTEVKTVEFTSSSDCTPEDREVNLINKANTQLISTTTGHSEKESPTKTDSSGIQDGTTSTSSENTLSPKPKPRPRKFGQNGDGTPLSLIPGVSKVQRKSSLSSENSSDLSDISPQKMSRPLPPRRTNSERIISIPRPSVLKKERSKSPPPVPQRPQKRIANTTPERETQGVTTKNSNKISQSASPVSQPMPTAVPQSHLGSSVPQTDFTGSQSSTGILQSSCHSSSTVSQLESNVINSQATVASSYLGNNGPPTPDRIANVTKTSIPAAANDSTSVSNQQRKSPENENKTPKNVRSTSIQKQSSVPRGNETVSSVRPSTGIPRTTTASVDKESMLKKPTSLQKPTTGLYSLLSNANTSGNSIRPRPTGIRQPNSLSPQAKTNLKYSKIPPEVPKRKDLNSGPSKSKLETPSPVENIKSPDIKSKSFQTETTPVSQRMTPPPQLEERKSEVPTELYNKSQQQTRSKMDAPKPKSGLPSPKTQLPMSQFGKQSGVKSGIAVPIKRGQYSTPSRIPGSAAPFSNLPRAQVPVQPMEVSSKLNTKQTNTKTRPCDMPVSVETLVFSKVKEEFIDLTVDPYTDKMGQYGIPFALVLRYGDELKSSSDEIKDALDHARLKQLQEQGRIGIPHDATDCCTENSDLNTASTHQFLVSAGLPMYTDLLELCGFHTMERLKHVTENDCAKFGIKDPRHIRRLLNAIDMVKGHHVNGEGHASPVRVRKIIPGITDRV